MESRVFVIIAALATILLVTLPGARSVLCYQCNSKKDPGCEELAPPPANGTARYLGECDDGPDGEAAFCRKSIIKVARSASRVDEERVVRACGWVKHKNECYQFDDGHHSEQVCQCFEDACNGARRVGAGTGAAAALFALALLLAQRF